MYVYKDRERTKEFYAKDALKEDKNTRYYCPNPNCNAHMYLCSVDGASSAYFRPTRKAHPHLKGCEFKSSNSFNPQKFDENAFDFENVLEAMRQPSKPVLKNKFPSPPKTGESKTKPLRTIRQIYDMCKSYPCTCSYNNLIIGQMLLDDRSEYMYQKGVFGNRVIEAKVKKGNFYDSKKMVLRLVAPSSQKYEFILQFGDMELFKTARDSLYNNRDKLIVVSGYWESSGTFNVFCTKFKCKNQITVIT